MPVYGNSKKITKKVSRRFRTSEIIGFIHTFIMQFIHFRNK